MSTRKELLKKNSLRAKRKLRIRSSLSGTAERPRLSVYRSSRHLHAQVIDDQAGRTLVSVTSASGKTSKQGNANVAACTTLGGELATRCQAANISHVVFDRNGFIYHGRIKAFADAAREAGLQF